MDQKKQELPDGEGTAAAVPEHSPGRASTGEGLAKISSRSEELYRQGQALFQQGAYESAIHVWTRILFLERGHARAKRAIERAKRAIAERQRELDAELADATRLVEERALDAATEKVREVLAIDPRNGEGHHLSARIVALKRRNGLRQSAPARDLDVEETRGTSPRGLLLRVSKTSTPHRGRDSNASPLKMAGFVLGAVLVFASGALYLHLNWEAIVGDGAFGPESALGPSSAEPTVGTVPTSSELHYYNGARLFDKGRYHEARQELSLVARDSPVAARARSLMLRIEERLLRGAIVPMEHEATEPAR